MPDPVDSCENVKKRKWEKDVRAYKKAVRVWNEAEDDLENKLKARDEAKRVYEKAQQDCNEANAVSRKRWADAFRDAETGKMLSQEIIDALQQSEIKE